MLPEGVRSTHNVDVWVTFTRFALEHFWYVECKFWNTPVRKEKVEVVKSIASEVGAEKAFILSESGFQSGAVTAAKKTNITLTSLEDLVENARHDLDALLIEELDRRATDLSERIRNLYVYKRTPSGGISRPRPGVDSARYMWMFSRAITVRDAARAARFAKFPTLIGWDSPDGDNPVKANSASDLIEQGGAFLDETEAWLQEQEEAVTQQNGWDPPD